MNRLTFAALAVLALGACKEDLAGPPLPVTMTAAAVGHYCQMDILEHPGPKAQVHLAGLPDPLFFSQVRDAVAYQRMPEQSHAIVAIYVSDMGKAPSWDDPGAANWTAAGDAVFVVGATVPGGMGAPELVPFAEPAAAAAFAARNGGEVMTLDRVPDRIVLAPVDVALDADGNFIPPDRAVAD
ncbi:MAG: copper resistance protein CopZ [Alphaproteobacteria bacterium HGW-Alphaproteobacteria-6]|nr:MAG: copper resistance protein CopZ [Alphaproteobacteria bacterium HGW-Alphaproteobacteria-6]